MKIKNTLIRLTALAGLSSMANAAITWSTPTAHATIADNYSVTATDGAVSGVYSFQLTSTDDAWTMTPSASGGNLTIVFEDTNGVEADTFGADIAFTYVSGAAFADWTWSGDAAGADNHINGEVDFGATGGTWAGKDEPEWTYGDGTLSRASRTSGTHRDWGSYTSTGALPTTLQYTNVGGTHTPVDVKKEQFILSGNLVQVPEPTSTALLGFGGLALMIRRRR